MCTSCEELFTFQNDISPLYVSSYEGHTEVIDILLENGANPNLATMVRELSFPSLQYNVKFISQEEHMHIYNMTVNNACNLHIS